MTAKTRIHRSKVNGGRARMQQLRDNGQMQQFQSNAGKKGAKAVMNKYGKAVLIEKIAAWRRTHPSGPEMEAYNLLNTVGINVRRVKYEYIIGQSEEDYDAYTEHIPFPSDNVNAYILDIAWPPFSIAIEIDGPVHDVFATPERNVYATTRDTVLKTHGWTVFHIKSADLHTDYGANVIAECLELVREQIDSDRRVKQQMTDDLPY